LSKFYKKRVLINGFYWLKSIQLSRLELEKGICQNHGRSTQKPYVSQSSWPTSGNL